MCTLFKTFFRKEARPYKSLDSNHLDAKNYAEKKAKLIREANEIAKGCPPASEDDLRIARQAWAMASLFREIEEKENNAR